MIALLLVAFAAFAALALFAPDLLNAVTARSRLRHPHRALLLVFRLWFAILAFLTLWLLFHPRAR